jgi:hypothetical protein
MVKKFDTDLSLSIDRAVIGLEDSHGLVRLIWRIRFWFLTRGIP